MGACCGRWGLAVLLLGAVGLSPARGEPSGDAAPEHGKIATADATPVGARTLEIEASYSPTWTVRGAGPFDRSAPGEVHSIGLAATCGLGEDVDLTAAVTWATAWESSYDHDPEDGVAPRSARGRGFGDTTVAGRWRFLRRAALELAVLGGAVAPTGARASSRRVGLTQGFWSAEGAVVATGDRGPITANLELGYALPFGADREDTRGVWSANAAAGWQALAWLQPELELNYQRTSFAGAPAADLLCITGGLLAPFGEGYRIAAGVQYAVWGRRSAQQLSGTVAFKWAY